MIRPLDKTIIVYRADFYRRIRSFFESRSYLEVETPLLNSTGNFEPFIDPFTLETDNVKKSPSENPFAKRGFLITSPEYNLKSVLEVVQKPLFQIAHSFRKGDVGPLHTQEFLLLEWYRPGADDFSLMDEMGDLLVFLSEMEWVKPNIRNFLSRPIRRTIDELFEQILGTSTERKNLETLLLKENLIGKGEVTERLRYDEIFFSIFLNKIEADLGFRGPEFVHLYPKELAANAKVVENRARRFELYVNGLELANGYFEITDLDSQVSVFEEENRIRLSLGKPTMEMDPGLRQALAKGLPECAGIAVGLDRLFAVLLGEVDLRQSSPFL